jgi:hypothetical protein
LSIEAKDISDLPDELGALKNKYVQNKILKIAI